jgi:hypothetical protein
MLRAFGLALLLLSASVGAVSAMDPSATEETNCLMACDANQEHCASTPHVTVPRKFSAAARLPSTRSRLLASSRRPVEGR